jgi:hypothetical protein
MLNDLEAKPAPVAVMSPQTISDEYIALQKKMHERQDYGTSGAKRAPTVQRLVQNIKPKSVLDYGCGKGLLAKELSFPIWEYDPAVPGKDELPRAAELVICTDVLEHVEPVYLQATLGELSRCTLKVGYIVISMVPSKKIMDDGRNTHLIQEGRDWWTEQLSKFFDIGKLLQSGPELHYVVGPKKQLAKAA